MWSPTPPASRRSPGGPAARSCALLLLAAALTAVLAAAAQGEVVRDGREERVQVRAVFERIAVAWGEADERGLADLVHGDGLRVVAGGDDRDSRYSPSQAYYYFQNLFRSHRTISFEYRMMQDRGDSDHARAMAHWQRRRTDSEVVQELKVICVLTRDGGNWRLSELTLIR